MKEQLAELLKYLKEAIEFGKEQLPMVAQEILRYYKVANWVFLGLSVVAICFSFALIFFYAKRMRARRNIAEKDGNSVLEDSLRRETERANKEAREVALLHGRLRTMELAQAEVDEAFKLLLDKEITRADEAEQRLTKFKQQLAYDINSRSN